LTLVLPIIGGCLYSPGGCQESSPTVAYARSIPAERLEQLYRDAGAQLAKGAYLSGVRPRDNNAPEWLEDLNYNNVSLGPGRAHIILEGCFDHAVAIQINGLGDHKSMYGNSLLLFRGEGPTSGDEILWSE